MLSELTTSSRRLALAGLAKNTGKTEALVALLRELQDGGRRVGVTSVGRDGEEHDVIDSRIEKPRLRLAAGSIVATTDVLLRASALPHELLQDTGLRTPLGRVLIARLRDAGPIEVAGPSVAADVRMVSDTMLAHGAEHVLIDGAVNRRAASSPEVADGLVMSTGAVLSRDASEVALQTRDAVDLVRLPRVDDSTAIGRRLRALAARSSGRTSMLVAEDSDPLVLAPRFVLSSEAEQIAEMLDANPNAHWLIVAGALPDRFLRSLLHPVHHRRRELVLVVADPTRVFLWKRGPEWYRRQGIHLQTLEAIALEAITVNPVAPQSHRFDSAELRELLEEAVPDVPIFDVLHPDYLRRRAPAL
jgi:hypothetical protein